MYSRLCLKLFLSTLFWSFQVLGQAQDLSLDNEKKQVTIEEATGWGYEASLDFGLKYVKKEFWRFNKTFAKLINWRSHYEVRIPSEDDRQAELSIWVKFKAARNRTQMQSLLNKESMTEADFSRLQSSADNLIREFKIYVYRKWLQDQITELEKLREKNGRKEIRLKKRLARKSDQLTQAKHNKLIEEQEKTLAKLEKFKSKFAEIK